MASSGDDDRVAFLYPENRKNVNWVDRYMEYTELQVKKDLQQQFMEAIGISHMKGQSAHLKDIGVKR
jgi:hypothetical protein